MSNPNLELGGIESPPPPTLTDVAGEDAVRMVDVYGPSGRIQTVPESWLDHPTLGRGLSRTPSSRPAGSPFETFTVVQLRQYAADNGINITGLTHKSDLIKAITNPTNQPPAGGGQE